MSDAAHAEFTGADPSLILGQLKTLWEKVTFAEANSDQPQPVVKATVGSFVVVLESQDSCAEVQQVVAKVAASYPARTIILIPNPALTAGEVQTVASISCAATGQNQSVCSERVDMYAAPAMVQWLYQTILALLIEDLPRTVWWEKMTFAGSPLYEHLVESFDRIIIDSRYATEDRRALESIVQALSDPDHPAISDLNWGRITPWREITAQAFEIPDGPQLLESVCEVHVTYIKPAEPLAPAAALLYIGWLAARLKWTAVSCTLTHDPECIAVLEWNNAAGAPVRTFVHCISREGHEHHLSQVLIRTCAPHAGEVLMVRSEDMRSAEMRIALESTTTISRHIALQPLELHQLLYNELIYAGRDLGYQQAVSAAAGAWSRQVRDDQR